MKLHSMFVPKTEVITSERIKRREQIIINDSERADIVIDNSGTELMIMTIANCIEPFPANILEKYLSIDEKPDVVAFLGNNSEENIKTLVNAFSNEYYGYGGIVSENMKIVGVLSGKDNPSLLRPYSEKIIDMNNNILLFHSSIFGGLSGSLSVRDEIQPLMFTNEESDYEFSELSKCDILFTYECPCWNPKTERTGLTGIANYIRNNQPKLVFYGHSVQRAIEYREGLETFIKGCTGIEVQKIKI